ncbi:MAG TPA: class I SAM-dependent methyltransferase [Bryobacteraceae bacterium]|nr:class I SAM-dependent methyltransferase [Bryobacteraceae bacterium]
MPATAYLMGHTDHERRRLSLQASVLNPFTRGFLQRAGVSAGMHVLDIGCGVGEVSFIAAALVGPHGHVTCIDIDDGALAIARARAHENAIDNVTFEHRGVLEHRLERSYDAVIGRHILIHAPDALAMVRHAVSLVHAGGIVAMQEYDLSRCIPPWPAVPLMERVQQVYVALFSRATPHADIGIRLFHLMQEAGLPVPEVRGEFVIDGGPDSPMYEWIAETIRSLLPRIEALGIATAAELDVESLAARLREETIAARAGIVGPTMIGAFARKQ